MNDQTRGSEVLNEFRSFLEFLRGLWGMLTAVSVLFPLSNALAKAIPLGPLDMLDDKPPRGAFAYLSAELVTVVTTCITLFVIVWTFGRRHDLRLPRDRRAVRRQARWSFALGLAALAAYLVGTFLVIDGFYWTVMGWGSGDARRAIGDIVLLALYSGFFALVTRAFELLGMIEYLGPGKHTPLA